MVDAGREISKREGRGSFLLWFGLLGGPIAWASQLVLNYSLEEWFACSPGTSTPGSILGYSTMNVAYLITGLLAAVALGSGLVSVVCYRKIDPDSHGDSISRARWMALAGIMNSVLYFIIILASFGPPALLGTCEVSP